MPDTATENDGEIEADGGTTAGGQERPGHKCDICGGDVAKYRCPACDRRTCCLACVNEHKSQYRCTGKRPRADYVAPLKSFTDHVVVRDFNFLDEVDLAVDRANRDIRRLGDEVQVHHSKRHHHRVALARACADPTRNLRLVLAPGALELARSNTSKVCGAFRGNAGNAKGKGKGFGKRKGKKSSAMGGSQQPEGKPAHIVWRVDWHFASMPPGPDGVRAPIVEKGLPEYEVLGPALARFLDNRWPGGATKHKLLPYVEAGLERLDIFLQQPDRIGLESAAGLVEQEDDDEEDGENDDDEEGSESESCSDSVSVDSEVARPSRKQRRRAARRRAAQRAARERPAPFCKLDKSLSLRENLMGRAIVEFPVLHVALPHEVNRFCVEPHAVDKPVAKPQNTG